jgi:hypothetical protein
MKSGSIKTCERALYEREVVCVEAGMLHCIESPSNSGVVVLQLMDFKLQLVNFYTHTQVVHIFSILVSCGTGKGAVRPYPLLSNLSNLSSILLRNPL